MMALLVLILPPTRPESEKEKTEIIYSWGFKSLLLLIMYTNHV